MANYRIIRWFAYAIEILVLFVLQETPGLIPTLGMARPILVIPAVLAVAMFESEIPAMLFGLLGGLLIDFGIGGMLGFHGILLAAACYGVSLIATNLMRTNFLTAMLISIVVAAAVVLLDWACFYVMSGYGSVIYALTGHYLPIFLYTAAIMPVTYYFNRALALQIRSKEE